MKKFYQTTALPFLGLLFLLLGINMFATDAAADSIGNNPTDLLALAVVCLTFFGLFFCARPSFKKILRQLQRKYPTVDDSAPFEWRRISGRHMANFSVPTFKDFFHINLLVLKDIFTQWTQKIAKGFILMGCLFSIHFTYAQQSPGGVSTGLNLWLKADAGFTSAVWTDQSVNANNALQGTAANQPLVSLGLLNYNPAVRFDGTNDQMNISATIGLTGTNDYTIFSVFSHSAASGARTILGGNASSSLSYELKPDNQRVRIRNSTAYATGTAVLNDGLAKMTATFRSGTSFNQFANGVADGTGTNAISFATPASMHVGSANALNYFSGDIAEVAVYSSALSATDREKVGTYLALKYGITLGHNYLSGTGSTIYNLTGYANNVAGLGRDDAQGLHQKQSRSVNTANSGDLVTIGLGAIAVSNAANANSLTNDTYMIWGDDAGAMTFTSAYTPSSFTPVGPFAHTVRLWKVQETGSVGTVQFRVPASTSATHLLVYPAGTSDFSVGATEIALTPDGNGNLTANVDFTDGQFFTLGKTILAPGTVLSNLKLWLRADAGTSTTTNGAVLDTWNDQGSFTDANASATGAFRPTYTAVDKNFNPSISFSGANVMTVVDANVLGGDNANHTIFIVLNPSDITARWVTGPYATGASIYLNASQAQKRHSNSAFLVSAGAQNAFSIGTQRILTMRYNPSAGGLNNAIRVDGNLAVSNTSISNFTDGTMTIGGHQSNLGHFIGTIPEVITYNTGLANADMDKVETYLALKYGITLTHNYVSGSGSTIYNLTGYANNVAGIGRDDAQGLHQKQSRSVNTANSGDLVTMGLGAIAASNAANANSLTNNTYMIWGDNNGTIAYTNAYTPSSFTPTATFGRLVRLWKVQETGTVGTVQIKVPATLLASHLLVYPAGTSDFSAGATEIALTPDGNGNLTANVDFTDGQFYTLGKTIPAPGTVFSNLKLWLKADVGTSTTTNGAVLDSWADQSPFANANASATGTYRPIYTAVDKNFNPGVDFQSNGDFMQVVDADVLGGDNANHTIFIMLNPDDVTGWFMGNSNSYTTGNAGYLSAGLVRNYHNGSAYLQAAGAANTFAVGQSRVVGIRYNPAGGAGNNNTIRIDGNPAVANATVSNYGDNYMILGGYQLNAPNFDGRISEVITYNTGLANADMDKVESYLALKYGATLTHNYVSGTGSTIYDLTGYANNVAGLGRDDAQGLHQKQSRSVNTANSGDLVTMGLGAIAAGNAANANSLTNNTYMIWGDNGAAANYAVVYTPSSFTPVGAFARYARLWKVQETGTVGSVQFRVPASTSASHLLMFPAGTTDFSVGATEIALTPDGNGNLTANVDFTNGQFFSIGRTLLAPGQVFSNLSMWLKADAGTSTTTDGAVVSSWDDQSDKGLADASATGAFRPTYKAIDKNFNPAINFSGSNVMTAVDADILGGDNANHTIFMVLNPTNITRWVTGPYATGASLYLSAGQAQKRHNNSAFLVSAGAQNAFSIGTQRILTMRYNPSAGGLNNAIRVDGNLAVSNTSISNFTDGPMSIGGYQSNAGHFIGTVPEVITYNTGLTNADMDKVETYLALRYSATLTHNYISGTGSTIYDRTTYPNNIAGIGRDDAQGLHQKQSRSSNTSNSGDLVTIGMGDIAASNAANANSLTTDNTYLVWGDDGANAVFTQAIPADPKKRLLRIWKATETGAVATVKFRFPASLFKGTSPTLYISNDAVFDNTDQVVPLVANASNYDATVDLSGRAGTTFYFSVAQKNPPAPGGVFLDLGLWTKADAGTGTTTNGAIVTTWSDQSGKANNATSITTGKPTYLANDVNYNPALDFNKNAGLQTVATTIPANTSYTKVAVFRPDAASYNIIGSENANGTTLWLGGTANNLSMWHNGIFITAAGSVNTARYYLGTGIYGKPSTISNSIRVDGLEKVTNTTTSAFAGTQKTQLGCQAASYFFDGKLSETVLYNRALQGAELNQVETYLALKYGLSLSHDYIASDGTTTLFSSDGAGATNTFDQNIAGIGLDVDGALNQKQSQSLSGDFPFTIGLGTVAASNASNPNSFASGLNVMVWGHNSGGKGFSNSIGGGLYAMPRVWLVKETGTVGTVKVRVPASAIIGSGPVLIRSADATIDGADPQTPLTVSGSYFEATIDFNNNDYFSFAAIPPTGPGGVIGASAWFRADAGADAAADNTQFQNWSDVSGTGTHASQATPASKPYWLENAVNFNPSADFRGAQSMTTADNNPHGGDGNAHTQFAVIDQDAFTSNATLIGGAAGATSAQLAFSAATGRPKLRHSATDVLVGDATTTTTLNIPAIVATRYDPAGLGNVVRKDGAPGGTNTTTTAFTDLGLQLGANNNALLLDGQMPEALVYPGGLTDANIERIESYLAIKYGIPLSHNYFASDGSTIFNADGAGAGQTYDRNIAGIGRDAASGLNQRQSRCVQTASSGNMVTIGLGGITETNAANSGVFASDKSFLIWGDDLGATTIATAIPGYPGSTRMARIWYADLTGAVGQVAVRLPRSYITVGGGDPVMIVSSDATFDASDTYVRLDTVGTDYEGLATFSGDSYFTFGKFVCPYTLTSPAPALQAVEYNATPLPLNVTVNAGVTSAGQVNFVAFTEQKYGTQMYTGGTLLTGAKSLSAPTLTYTPNTGDFPSDAVNSKTYFVYAIPANPAGCNTSAEFKVVVRRQPLLAPVGFTKD